MSDDLSLVSTDALIDEIKRRSFVGFLCYAQVEDLNSREQTWMRWGDLFTVIGLCHMMLRQFESDVEITKEEAT